MLKAQIEGATFPGLIKTGFYKDRQSFTLARGQAVDLNARISLAGGIVTHKFTDLFGAETTDGFHDRILFGLCPDGYEFVYQPPSGQPAIERTLDDGDFPVWATVERPVPVTIDADVWQWKRQTEKILGAECGRSVELAIRCAYICASFDGRTVLRAADLGPAFALAKYQTAIRKLLKPNPGKNDRARLGNKVLDYLKAHAPEGQWVRERTLLNSTNAYDFGLDMYGAVVAALAANGHIERAKQGRKYVLRLTE